MRTPYVNAVGLTVYPHGYSDSPHRVSVALRVVAALLVVLFAVTVVATTVVSVGDYCLTSDAGDTRTLPAE